MKIIKEGNINATKRFECKRCGCIWEADKGEYEYTPLMAIQHDNLKPYWMKCPICKSCVDVN